MVYARLVRLLVGSAVAMGSTAVAAAPLERIEFDAGVAVGSLAGAKEADGFFAKAVTIPAGATSYNACVKAENGQMRLADERGCGPSEIPVSLAAGNVAPFEVSRFLTIPPGAGGIYSGIFGGLICPAGRKTVSGGFQILRQDVKVQESFIGPGFGLPRVYIVASWTFTFSVLPEGDVIKMWATCL